MQPHGSRARMCAVRWSSGRRTSKEHALPVSPRKGGCERPGSRSFRLRCRSKDGRPQCWRFLHPLRMMTVVRSRQGPSIWQRTSPKHRSGRMSSASQARRLASSWTVVSLQNGPELMVWTMAVLPAGPVQKTPMANPAASAAPSSSHRPRSSLLITLGAKNASGVWAWVQTTIGSATARSRHPVAIRSI